MLRSLTGGQFITVENGYSPTPYIPSTTSNNMAGMMKFNSSTGNVEVFDGSTWLIISNLGARVGLTADASQAITWALKRIEEEKEWERSNHPAMKLAVENLQRARQQLEITAILIKEEYNNE